MLVSGDYVLIRSGDVHVRYFIPERTKKGFRGFDRGVGDYVFEAPRDKQPGGASRRNG